MDSGIDRNIHFLVDEMHGKLSVWLRILGYDVKYSRDYEVKYGKSVQDKNLIIEALETGKVLLTGDKQMYEIIMDKAKRQNKVLTYRGEEIPHAIKIKQGLPENQLVDLKKALPLLVYDLNLDEGRCTICGGKNVVVNDKADVKDKVCEGVYNDIDQFWICEGCGKVFWVGAQTKNIIATYNKMMEIINSE
ncbi:hypothetical protein QTN25_008298 [Entamoeba marina]